MDKDVIIEEARKLHERRDITIRVSEAPDGADMLLGISRSVWPDFDKELQERLGLDTRSLDSSQDKELISVFGRLAGVIDAESRKMGIHNVRISEGSAECYVTAKTIRGITKSTVLERLLSGPGPTITTGIVADTRIVSDRAMVDYVSQLTTPKHFAVPLDGSSPFVARAKGNQLEFLRPFRAESLMFFDTLNMCFYTGDVIERLSINSFRKRLAGLTNIDRVRFEISRKEIVDVIVRVAYELIAQHRRGVIHGDIKPGNILVTRDGVKVIDPLDISEGDVSPAMTPGWAAPEQVVGEPVTPQTDQYPIGLMLISLFMGTVYGEERTFLIPSGGTATQRFQILDNGRVFLDPKQSPLPSRRLNEWRAFLQKCVRFNPKERFSGIEALIGELKHLNESAPPAGTVGGDATFGSFKRLELGAGGSEYAWIEYDKQVSAGLRRVCPSCGHQVKSHEIFCENCGYKVLSFAD